MYSDNLIEHFLNPRNTGTLPRPDGVGTMGDPECGDFLRIYIKIKDKHISDIKFEILGCPAAIATSSVLTELAIGESLDKALKISDLDIIQAIGGLPDPKVHCSNLGAGALHEAIRNYLEKTGHPVIQS